MREDNLIPDIQEALENRERPTITQWQQLLGHPRSDNFNRALKAEIRDPLWMLTRQWQLGEFKGDDAGSPIFTQIHIETTALNKYHPRDHQAESFESDVPLETKVECLPIPFSMGAQSMSLDIRLLMGRYWLKLLHKKGLAAYRENFIERFAISPPDPTQPSNADVCAHAESWQTVAAVAGRSLDGGQLYLYLKEYLKQSPEDRGDFDGLNLLNEADKRAIDSLVITFIQWFEKLYYQPSTQDAWDPARLEYQFACSAPAGTDESAPARTDETVFTAEEYYHGHLDWYNFNLDPTKGLEAIVNEAPVEREKDGSPPRKRIPTPISFDGMPNTRWWTFEDGTINFGNIKLDTTDLAKLLLIEFGLVYANDWFLVPYKLPIGTLAQVRGIVVTNVFGERFWISAADENSILLEPSKKWEMFTLNASGHKVNSPLMLLPTVESIQESNPLEDIVLIRDEVANMVWGIERKVPLAHGIAKPGNEVALQTRNFYQNLLTNAPDDLSEGGSSTDSDDADDVNTHQANVRYQVMTEVPENWIPFIPVQIERDHRSVQVERDHRSIKLQRAAMPRILQGDTEPPEKIRPRTTLLRQGLEQGTDYFLHEEEVPRGGVRITQSFQRTRWHGGQAFVWLGTRKQTGWGEGTSSLLFDQLVDIENP